MIDKDNEAYFSEEVKTAETQDMLRDELEFLIHSSDLSPAFKEGFPSDTLAVAGEGMWILSGDLSRPLSWKITLVGAQPSFPLGVA